MRNAATSPVSTPVTPGTPPSGSTGTTVPKDTAAPSAAQPGPSQLYQKGLDLINRGSYATGRAVLQEMLTTYATSDLAPDAQYYIAESLFKEKNWAAADPAYAAVVSSYPNSSRVRNALYKRGQVAVQLGNIPQARQYFEQVIARFPRSDEAELAAETLKTLR